MGTNNNKLEQRVAALEAEVIELRAALATVKPGKDWRRVVGMFDPNDEVMKRIDEYGRQYREADRERAQTLRSQEEDGSAMIIMDTDHVSVLKYVGSPACNRLRTRMELSVDKDVNIAVVSVEEQLRGWLAEINRHRAVHAQLRAYDELASLLEFFNEFRIVRFHAACADHFDRLRKQKVRIGSMDLKIASIALAHDAPLLTANTRDFGQAPGLRLANWLADEPS